MVQFEYMTDKEWCIMIYNITTRKEIEDILKQHKNDVVINIEKDITVSEPICIDGCKNIKLMSQKGAKLSGGVVVEKFKREGRFLTYETAVEPRIFIVNSLVKPRSSYPDNGCLECLDITDVKWMNSINGGWNRPPEHYELTHMTANKEDIPAELDILNCDIRAIHVWDESTVSVKEYDSDTGIITTSSPMAHPAGAFKRHQYQFLNTMYGLKDSGTWCYNRAEHKIYYLPEEGENENNIKAILPVSNSVIKITNSEDVVIENLSVFASNSETGVIAGLRAVNPLGAIQVESSENVTLDMLEISLSSGQGVKFLQSKNIEVSNCIISKCASCGIMTFECENEKISHNEITNIGMYDYSAIAIHAGGKSLLVYVLDGKKEEKGQSIIEYNTIDNAPYCGITCNGGPHIIRFNKITNCMTKLHDGAAIYCSRSNKTLVEGNYVTKVPKLPKAHAIYFDELSEDCVVDGNLAVDIFVPFLTHMAKRIVYKNNIAISDDDIKLHFLKSYSLNWHNNIIQSKGNVNFVFSHFVHEEYTLEQFIELDNNVLSCESTAVIYDPSGTCETKDKDAILNHQGVLLTDKKVRLENQCVFVDHKLTDIESRYIATKIEPHCIVTEIKPEMEEKYIKLHNEIWDQVVKNGHIFNIRNYSIFKYKNLYISFFEYVGDNFEEDMKEKAKLPITKKWKKLCDECYVKSEIDPELIFFNRF